jgi:hypothetical protein
VEIPDEHAVDCIPKEKIARGRVLSKKELKGMCLYVNKIFLGGEEGDVGNSSSRNNVTKAVIAQKTVF